MRVAFAGHSEDFAGAESSLLMLLGQLDPGRHAPLVTLPTHGPFSERLEHLGVPVAYVESVPWADQRGAGIPSRFGPGLEGRVQAFVDRLRREEVTLVVSNSAVAVEAALAAHRLGLPHVWRIHEMLFRHDNLEFALARGVYPVMLSALSHRVLAVSQAVRDDLQDVEEDRVRVLPNGLPLVERTRGDRRARVGVDASVPMVVFVGTLSAAKGVPLLAPLMKRVRAGVPSACCVVVGRDVGAQHALQRDLRRKGLGGAFRFLGFRDDAVSVIALADALILPSRVDSLPCVVMEAMSAGVPAVATRSGGASELIVHGETGYLADIDDVPAMADGLVRLLRDASHARRLGEAARERARRHYSLEAMVDGFGAALDDADRGPRRPPGLEASRGLVARFSDAAGPSATPGATRRLLDALQRFAT